MNAFTHPEFYRSSCEGKEQFETWTLADQVRKRMRLRRDKNLQVYRCEFGSPRHYHIGRKREHRLARGRPMPKPPALELAW